jgi:hypothetical protein
VRQADVTKVKWHILQNLPLSPLHSGSLMVEDEEVRSSAGQRGGWCAHLC